MQTLIRANRRSVQVSGEALLATRYRIALANRILRGTEFDGLFLVPRIE